MSVVNPAAKHHVHFAPDQNSGSHAPPTAFRIPKEFRPIVEEEIDPSSKPNAIQYAKLAGERSDVVSKRLKIFFYAQFCEEHLDSKNPDLNSDISKIWNTPVSAIVDASKSIMMTIIETVRYLFSKIFNSQKSATHLEHLKMQCRAIQVSLIAVYSPEAAVAKYKEVVCPT